LLFFVYILALHSLHFSYTYFIVLVHFSLGVLVILLVNVVFDRHTEFEVNGVKHIRLLFYIQGPESKGTVHVEARQVLYA